ncbi:MAG: SIS domain-containing protein [Terriglobia bacterium]|jgi:glucosamine--fructose-6-phosphate aminotransferase (isomerizing)
MGNPDPKYRIIEGAYLLDILDQPRALEATIEGLSAPDALLPIAAQLKQGTLKRVVLTGMGSSFHALYPLHLLLASRGCATLWAETSELIHYLPQVLDPATLIIAVSQSGRSAEILSLLNKNDGRAQIIAVTNTTESPLGAGADAVLLTNAGEEFSVSCKTYVTALVVLRQLGALLGYADPGTLPSELEQAPPAAATYLNSWRDHVLELAVALENVQDLFFVGRGISLAAVGTGALITKESSHYHAEGMSSAAFRHGPLEMVSEKTFVGVFAGAKVTLELNAKLVEDIRRKGGRAELIGAEAQRPSLWIPAVPDSVIPILEILPVEMITLALAAQTGREAGRFSFASKVTTIE